MRKAEGLGGGVDDFVVDLALDHGGDKRFKTKCLKSRCTLGSSNASSSPFSLSCAAILNTPSSSPLPIPKIPILF
ncbi:unnamed protein product [Citrullus colocynthis]|uniref:Uncharacterized protein n=1 Tax=Citrullus colocynthis TaxID=252529 RepID=A0ABP0YGC7_9ROSI